MKKLLVAVSAISTFAITTNVSADMSSWTAKKPSQAASSTQAAQTPQIEQAPQAQAATGSTAAQAEVHTQVQTLPSQTHPAPAQPRPQIAPGEYHPQQPQYQGQVTPPPQTQNHKPQVYNPQQQQQNNQVANETANQERVARAIQNAMPNAVSVLNTPSLNNTQKNYGFSYIAAVSQMISDPKNMNVASIQQTYNTAVTCAARTGAGNVIAQMQGILLRDQALAENFKIAQGRGNFIAIGQQAPGVTCS